MVSTKTSSWRQRLPATRTQSGDRFMDTGVGGWWNLTQEQYPNYWMHHLPPNLRHSVPPSDCSLSLSVTLSLSLSSWLDPPSRPAPCNYIYIYIYYIGQNCPDRCRQPAHCMGTALILGGNVSTPKTAERRPWPGLIIPRPCH